MNNGSSVKLPNALSREELLDEGKSPEQVEHIMNQRVFGHDYQKGADGKPVEKGKGSATQQTGAHLEALRVANERKANRGGVTTVNSGVDAKTLSEAVAAGVRAGLEHAKSDDF